MARFILQRQNNEKPALSYSVQLKCEDRTIPGGGGGALGYFLGGYVPPGSPNWHPVLKKTPKIGTPL